MGICRRGPSRRRPGRSLPPRAVDAASGLVGVGAAPPLDHTRYADRCGVANRGTSDSVAIWLQARDTNVATGCSMPMPSTAAELHVSAVAGTHTRAALRSSAVRGWPAVARDKYSIQ